MRTRELMSAGPLTWQQPALRVIPLVRDLLMVVMAGVVAAWLGPLLGRHVRVGLGMPLLGSVVATLPRALLLLVAVACVNRAGGLTVAAVAEVLARAAVGAPGLMPTGLAAPIVAGAVADATWNYFGSRRSLGTRLALTGAVLAGARVVTAWVMMAWVAPLPPGMRMPTAAVCGAVVAVDVLLGVVAGILASSVVRTAEKGQ